MRWISGSRDEKPIAPQTAAMIAMRAQQPNAPPALLSKAAHLAHVRSDNAGAIELFSRALKDDPGTAPDWFIWAQAHFQLKDFDAAIRCARRGEELHGDYGPLISIKAKALLAQGEEDTAIEAFWDAARSGSPEDAMFELLRHQARKHDGKALLVLTDQIAESFGENAVTHSNRAIAHSMLADVERTSRLIDLDRQVQRRSIREMFSEPELSEFHETLIAESMAIAPLGEHSDLRVEYRPNVEDKPAMQRLFAWACEVYEDYMAGLDAERESQWFDPDIETATLFHAVTIIRKDEKNGQHVHRPAMISGVYHLLIDDAVYNSGDDCGSLELGNVDQYAAGHQGIWGKRLIRPEPGQFTMFPAHVFHDVVPTRSDALRISIPMDVQAMNSDSGERSGSMVSR